MTFDDLKLRPGYPLQVQVETSTGMSERYPCRFVGAMPGRALLLSVPRVNGRFLRLRPGQKVVARMMVARDCGAIPVVESTESCEDGDKSSGRGCGWCRRCWRR